MFSATSMFAVPVSSLLSVALTEASSNFLNRRLR